MRYFTLLIIEIYAIHICGLIKLMLLGVVRGQGYAPQPTSINTC